MPLRMEFPILKTFSFVEYVENGERLIRRANDGEPADGFVVFRQAAIDEAEVRTGLASKRKFASTDDSDFTLIDDLNPDALARQEIFMTLAGTDIEYPDGKTKEGEIRWTTLEFIEPSGYPKPKSLNQFNKWWGQMNPKWGRVIHECCLEVNPSWAMKS